MLLFDKFNWQREALDVVKQCETENVIKIGASGIIVPIMVVEI
jgi:hypothetical protein